MFDVKSVAGTFKILEEEFAACAFESETISLREAVGRITFEDIRAFEDIPGFSRSSVDGYAVFSSDTFGCSESIPAQLELAGEVRMGEKPEILLRKGQTAYIPTGGELPEGTDAVVMIEYSENYEDGFIYLNKSAAPGNNVVFKGDDVKAGSAVIGRNRRLRPQDIGALAAMGISKIKVKRKIRVGIISTGDEVVDIREKQEGSKVRDVNTYSLFAGIQEYGGEPLTYGIVKDDYEEIRAVTEKALEDCDVVLISGGSSVGNRDETFKVINSLGNPGVLVHGIAVKPGKPTIIGKVGTKSIIGLPGHPGSAYFIFRIFVLRLLDILNGVQSEARRTVRARMACNYPSNNGREEYVPVRLESDGESILAHPVFGKSGLITLLTAADGYVHIGRGAEGLAAGAQVEVEAF